MNFARPLIDKDAKRIARQVLGLTNPMAWKVIRQILSYEEACSGENMSLVWIRLKQLRKTMKSKPAQHHRVCEWWTDQSVPSDCTCGATMPKAPWFDVYAQACADAVEQQRREREEKNA